MFKSTRQHPIVIFTGIFKELKSFVGPILIALLLSRGDGFLSFDMFFFLFLGGMLILSLVWGFLKWFFFIYDYEDGVLHTKSGIIIKKHRYIKKERVQTINLKAGPILRILQLVSLQIETAGGFAEPELNIAAVSISKAKRLKELLKSNHEKEVNEGKKEVTEERKEEAKPVSNHRHVLSFKTLIVAGLTSGGVGIIFSIIGIVFSQVIVFIPDEMWEMFFEQFMITVDQFMASSIVGAIAFLVFVILITSWILSAARMIISYAFFTIERGGDDIQITRGLLEKKQLTLKLHRIQAVTIIEGIIRQPFGFATLQVEVAGGASQDESYTTIIHPLIKVSQIQHFLDEMIPEYKYTQADIKPLPKRSLKRYMIRGVAPFLLLLPIFYFVPFAWIGSIIFLPIGYLAYRRYKDGGSYVKDDMLQIRFRKIARVTALVTKSHMQNLALSTNFLQKRSRVTTLSTTVLSAPACMIFSVKDVCETAAKDVFAWYSRSTL